jgi:hypothetical protein
VNQAFIPELKKLNVKLDELIRLLKQRENLEVLDLKIYDLVSKAVEKDLRLLKRTAQQQRRKEV